MNYNPNTISVRGFAETRPKVSYKDPAGNPLKGQELRRARQIFLQMLREEQTEAKQPQAAE